jgi:NAD(P)-dependent dehydrogenase (short-subunit alcohol dehydrogenase family)
MRAGEPFDKASCERLFRVRFVLGWPALVWPRLHCLADGEQADMVKRVLIIGGYGNYGGYIARSLAREADILLLIGGRSEEKARAFSASLDAVHPAESCALDIVGDVGEALKRIAPDIVIHTSGPFQVQDHRVARACISQGRHYLDLADAREFVATIDSLDAAAKANGVLVVSGASSVPCLTAAVIDAYLPAFERLESVDYGISAAQQTNRGLATASAVLSYVGKPMPMLREGVMTTVYGWEDTHAQHYPGLGWRLFGNCDIPDLTLFPRRYPTLKWMRFAAGHELKLVHFGTRALGALVRLGLIRSLKDHAEGLMGAASLFNRFGTGSSGFHMILSGADREGKPTRRLFMIIARDGHGAYIPCMPAILLTRRLVKGEVRQRGASPCVDLINLKTYLTALEGLDVSVIRDPPDA